MRRILFVVWVLCATAALCHAQGGRVAGQFNAELGGNYFLVEDDGSYYDMYGPSISLGGGVRFCDYLFLGVATGLDLMIDQGTDEIAGIKIENTTWYRKYFFPIDVNMRGYIPMSRTSPFYLYVDVAAGPLCRYEKYYYVDGFKFKGFHLKTGIGLSYKKFSFTMGWEKIDRQESIYLRAGITLGRYTKY